MEHSLSHRQEMKKAIWGQKKKRDERKEEREERKQERERERGKIKERGGRKEYKKKLVWGGMGVNHIGVDDQDEDILIQICTLLRFIHDMV